MRVWMAVVLLGCAPVQALAQLGTGRVTGIIRDDRGRPIKGATVTAANENYFPNSFTSATDAKGRFNLLGLRRATYKMTVRAEGFEPVTFDMPVVSGSANRPVDLSLVPAITPGPPPLLANVDTAKLQKDLDEAAAHVAAGRTDAAIAAYRKIAQSAPALTTVHLQLGYLHELKGDRREAIAAYEAALKGDPDNDRARTALARLK